MKQSNDEGAQAHQSVAGGFALAKKANIKDAVAVSVQGTLYDMEAQLPLSAFVNADDVPLEKLEDLSVKEAEKLLMRRSCPEALPLLRHDAAHLLAQAVQSLYKGVQVAIGPATKDGFYYDFLFPKPVGEDALDAIEKRMHELVDADHKLFREEWSRAQALDYFTEKDPQPFKIEIIEALPEDAVITVYRQGDFLDLCRGPHAPSTGVLGHGFKLLRLAGAYWRGDAKRPMLQRIYGTYFPNEKQLRVYLKQREEAEKRDHRKLGRALDLFHLQEEAQGDVFWHPKGWTVYRLLQAYVRARMEQHGYQEIKTPQVLSRNLWEASGHWDKFREAMLTCNFPEGHEMKEPVALKPMNCPGHVELFKERTRSYRDLPLRLAEFGCCSRFEPSGALFGLMRLRAFIQDDAHIFCTSDMIADETRAFCALLHQVYKDLGFDSVEVLFSDRPAVRAGDEAVWDKAEEALQVGAKAANLTCGVNPGEGAFYGPKLEFVLKDALGRSWQCGTLQVDFILPQRLGATYIGDDGAKHVPVMLHRAILGSFERFLGILIEHYGGAFPLWLAPVQAMVLPITSDVDRYAQQVASTFQEKGFRVEADIKAGKVHGKIREYSMQKVPYLFVVGEKEAAAYTISVRTFGSTASKTMKIEEMLQALASKGRMPHDQSVKSHREVNGEPACGN